MCDGRLLTRAALIGCVDVVTQQSRAREQAAYSQNYES